MNTTMVPGKPRQTRSHSLRVLIADDSPLALPRLRAALGQMPRVDVVGEATRTHEALDLFRLYKPEVVVVSVALPSAGGFNVLRCVKQLNPECDVILTLQWRERFVEAVGLLLGATAVCPTFDGAKQICALIESRVRAYGCA